MNKISKKKILFFLIGLYTILPDYIKILGQNSALICACVIFACFYLLGFHKTFKVKKTEILFPFIYIALACTSYAIHGELDLIIRTILEKGFLLLLIERSLRNQKDVDDLIDTIILFSVFEALTAVFHFFSDINVFSFVQSANLPPNTLNSATQYRSNMVRVEGSFGHAITFAIYISICACLSLYRYNGTKEKKYIVYYVLQCLTLIFTVSRLPILVFFASQFIYLVSLKPKKVLKLSFSIVLCIAISILVIYISAPRLFEKALEITNIVTSVFSEGSISGIKTYNSNSAFGYRAEMLRVLPSIIKEQPVFGIGNSGYQSSSFYFMIGNFKQKSIDNEYFLQLVIYGVCGFAALCWWLFGLHFYDKRKKSTQKVTSIRFYQYLILLIYSLNLFSVAMMFEYKLIIVLYAVFLFDILDKSNGRTDKLQLP